MKKNNYNDINTMSIEELRQEVGYLRRCSELTLAEIMKQQLQSVSIRHELEQKRRGFSLMADLAVSMGRDSGYTNAFVSISKRINAALYMQRTAVLKPENGRFNVTVLQGYSYEEKTKIMHQEIPIEPELMDPQKPVLITSADSPERLKFFRQVMLLPYLITSPVILHNEVVAILVTGRVEEQPPFMPPLGQSDLETLQTVGTYLAALLAGERLIEAEERTKIMLDATPLCCNFWDENYNNIDCNEEAPRLFGLASKQEYLDKFFELSPKYQPSGRLSSELALEKIKEAFEKGNAKFEWMHQKLDGEPVPAEITLVRVAHGNHYIVAGYTRDMRELKAMLAKMHKKEQELRLARDLAEKNSRAKSEFLANISHEIRTPMNAIVGLNHLLGETELTDKQQDYVDKSDQSAHLLLAIINEILDFSKIDAGRMELENIKFSIPKIVNHVHEMLTTHAEAKSLDFNFNIDKNVPEFVIGDPLRLKQILLNLTNNAIKFTSAGKVAVHVSAALHNASEACLQFIVQDTGIGMDDQQISNLFTPFTQADTSTTRKYGGTGLGLAISHSLIELMGGKIWCESSLGQGSKFIFTITLPIAIENGEESTSSSTASCTAADDSTLSFESLCGLRVLLAEDNDINQMIANEFLADAGVIVDTVNNGLEALDAVSRKAYDLVLMDIQMPEMDGLTATKKIREMPEFKDLPIIAMTAHALAGDREVSLDWGMNDHLTKPIDPELLYKTLMIWDKRAK